MPTFKQSKSKFKNNFQLFKEDDLTYQILLPNYQKFMFHLQIIAIVQGIGIFIENLIIKKLIFCIYKFNDNIRRF